MNRLQVASLRFALGCVVLAYPAGPASAAGKYDGSKPMLCAITSTTECTADGKCERSAPQAGNNLPTFVRVDVKGKLLTDNDGSGRKTEIKVVNVLDAGPPGEVRSPGGRRTRTSGSRSVEHLGSPADPAGVRVPDRMDAR